MNATVNVSTSTTIQPSAVRPRQAGFGRDVLAISGRALRAVPREVETVVPPVFIALFFFVVNIGTLEKLTEQGVKGLDFKAFMMATAEYFRRHRWAWIASTTAFWNDPDRHRQKERMTRRDRYEKYLRELIQEAIDAGEIRDVDVAMTGRMILSTLNWMHRWYNPNMPMKPEQIADVYYDLVFKGLRAGKER